MSDTQRLASLLVSATFNRVADLMGKSFIATTVTRTELADGMIEITLSDASGNTRKVCASADVAQALAQVFGEFAKASQSTSSLPTKLPSTFAVGSGRYERFVLVRFENDVPYGLSADDAAELGRAILEEAAIVSELRPALVQ